MSSEIHFGRYGAVGEAVLARPKALNALSLDMIRELGPWLGKQQEDPEVAAIVVSGEGDRAFCAGGDVRAVYDAGIAIKAGGEGSVSDPGTMTADFFREEYNLNRAIHHCTKPYIAIVDGISMGGGLGLSFHGLIRVITERTLFAMPETGIGLFPDVGGGWFLPRMPGETGTYLALTGHRCGPADAMYLGYGTHYVPSESLDALRSALGSLPADAGEEAVVSLLDTFGQDPGPAPIAERRSAIDDCFDGDTVQEIFDALAAHDTDWTRATLQTLGRMSPTSLAVTLAQLRMGRAMDYDEMVRIEYRLSQGCMRGHDFYEGIRALLVDKDKSPRWAPARLADVTKEIVEDHFKPLGANDLSI
ncbi:enoyl-CoA hydratase/isomerase family protein [Fodinicurvata sp. EGI_FJ10296]|uniref:enoyl-CoA hydratase/isomerase family protein n=1 Tax=Fodinicurvata sp. EGI_FJ10296 TaxID=3231908 RepID=UPI003455AD51